MTFDFYLEEKKASENYCLYKSKLIIMKKWKNQSIPRPILCVTTNFVCNVTTNRFISWWKKWWIIALKSANYFPETKNTRHPPRWCSPRNIQKPKSSNFQEQLRMTSLLSLLASATVIIIATMIFTLHLIIIRDNDNNSNRSRNNNGNNIW